MCDIIYIQSYWLAFSCQIERENEGVVERGVGALLSPFMERFSKREMWPSQ